ncbi:hypothetical protein A3E66_05170 [Candidatus Daviesbacteria bacterium RIFCSPHIGHO2_12_FULL_37_16]|uniref:Four helix bundle protein n=1 Tax=Candidatus Daviesbacteria bacterium RIFCSPHIGHO2_12_FULL_37_16 TaxID=1797778 RepID=A0A1F5K5J1_9BACT|nr:MAG: hypothetical protein A3C99_01480 [Candidatus Daviesbacteria bacterium RIFCSPHIGHO2_02_FULL_37_9]OGE36243.1 MAG: hypothetical protein A3E66_05170 [Candidatus Daviesbacteria bacterium RIFCSPHIGHO2_12_FULL_37_16]
MKSFEDLIVWQKSRLLNQKIYMITSKFPASERSNLTSQLRRASVSVSANIAEGFGRYHSQESMQFYRTARGSLLEIRSHLYICLDQKYMDKVQLNEAISLIEEVSKMLSGLIKQTKNYRLNKLSSDN